MTNPEFPNEAPEPADLESRPVQKPDLSTSGPPPSALTELTPNGAISPRPTGRGASQQGIEWVRPTELAPRVGGDMIARGADAHRDAHAWVRARLKDATTRSDRARRLPPLSAFGKNGPTSTHRDALGR